MNLKQGALAWQALRFIDKHATEEENVFELLPVELVENIFSFLSVEDLEASLLVCRHWYRIGNTSIRFISIQNCKLNILSPASNNILWRHRIRSRKWKGVSEEYVNTELSLSLQGTTRLANECKLSSPHRIQMAICAQPLPTPRYASDLSQDRTTGVSLEQKGIHQQTARTLPAERALSHDFTQPPERNRGTRNQPILSYTTSHTTHTERHTPHHTTPYTTPHPYTNARATVNTTKRN